MVGRTTSSENPPLLQGTQLRELGTERPARLKDRAVLAPGEEAVQAAPVEILGVEPLETIPLHTVCEPVRPPLFGSMQVEPEKPRPIIEENMNKTSVGQALLQVAIEEVDGGKESVAVPPTQNVEAPVIPEKVEPVVSQAPKQ